MKNKTVNIILKIVKFFILFGGIFEWIGAFLELIGFQKNIKLAIICIIFSILLTLLFLSANYIFIEKKSKYYIDSNNLDKIQKLLKNTTELKIFSCASGSYRVILQLILKNMKNIQLRKIKILIREDNSSDRDIIINDQIRLWQTDIAEVYQITVEIHKYKINQIALRGYIFDQKNALLGWYYNDGNKRYGNNKIFTLFSSESQNQKEIIDFANNTFDSIFYNKKINELNYKVKEVI